MRSLRLLLVAGVTATPASALEPHGDILRRRHRRIGALAAAVASPGDDHRLWGDVDDAHVIGSDSTDGRVLWGDSPF